MRVRLGLAFGIACAVLLHVGILLFGGVLLGPKPDTARQVELISEELIAQEEEEEEEPEPPPEDVLETQEEPPPDAAELMRNLQLSAAASAPELEAASLGAIEAALNGLGGGGGEFSDALSFSSGGRIGGTGRGGAMDAVFGLAELDQKPRPIFQASPVYPARMRKVRGVVSVTFVVDTAGNVREPQVEESTHAAFDKPALDAVKQWKFEPGIKGGERVSTKIRVPIYFQPRS
jgi:protein TonB